MEIIKEDDYESMAANHQYLEVAWLNEVLIRQGITDKEIREKICGEFIFRSGEFLDSGWLLAEDKRVYPQLCYLETKDGADKGEANSLYIPSDQFAFHEYAFGNVDAYFEEDKEKVSDLEFEFS